MSTCQVKECRFSQFHTTKAHKCGTCGEFGHGQIECKNNRMVDFLRQYDNDILDVSKRCTMPYCEDPETHTRASHHCYKCGRQDHASVNCIIQSLDEHINRFNLNNRLQNFRTCVIQDYPTTNIVIPLHIGMGCQLFLRYKGGEFLSLFMHSDNHGQYGPATDDTPILTKFMEGCLELPEGTYCNDNSNVKTEIQCPLCRTEHNVKDDILDIRGSSEECQICFNHNVQKFFSKCGHACVCATCLDRLIKED